MSNNGDVFNIAALRAENERLRHEWEVAHQANDDLVKRHLENRAALKKAEEEIGQLKYRNDNQTVLVEQARTERDAAEENYKELYEESLDAAKQYKVEIDELEHELDVCVHMTVKAVLDRETALIARVAVLVKALRRFLTEGSSLGVSHPQFVNYIYYPVDIYDEAKKAIDEM